MPLIVSKGLLPPKSEDDYCKKAIQQDKAIQNQHDICVQLSVFPKNISSKGNDEIDNYYFFF